MSSKTFVCPVIGSESPLQVAELLTQHALVCRHAYSYTQQIKRLIWQLYTWPGSNWLNHKSLLKINGNIFTHLLSTAMLISSWTSKIKDIKHKIITNHPFIPLNTEYSSSKKQTLTQFHFCNSYNITSTLDFHNIKNPNIHNNSQFSSPIPRILSFHLEFLANLTWRIARRGQGSEKIPSKHLNYFWIDRPSYDLPLSRHILHHLI